MPSGCVTIFLNDCTFLFFFLESEKRKDRQTDNLLMKKIDSKQQKVCKTILFTSQNGSKAATVYAHANRGQFTVVRRCGVRSRQATVSLLCIEDNVQEISWSLLHQKVKYPHCLVSTTRHK